MVHEMADMFFRDIKHKVPSKDCYNKTIFTIDYLLSNGFSSKEITKLLYLTEQNEEVECINYDVLPDYLWQDSLIEKNIFYIHNRLKLTAPASYIDSNGIEIIPSFYIEPLIRFTMNDLLNYYYDKCTNFNSIRNDKKFVGQLKALLSNYDKIDYDIKGLDILLHLIDVANFNRNKILEPFNLDNSENLCYVIEELRKKYAEAKIIGANKYIWRTEIVNK